MNNLSPYYRIQINNNLLKYPQFFEFLRQEFRKVLINSVIQGNLDLTEEYKFTITYIPNQWGSSVIQQVKLQETVPDDKKDPKWKKISSILVSLDPMNPVPVDVTFTLDEIIKFSVLAAKHYQEIVTGGVVDYFGIEPQLWFNDYPIQTGVVLRAVDFGTLENKPKHLFDETFMDIRSRLMDLFTFYINHVKEVQENMVRVKNVNI